ncbi:right-handed parallel beta-helix repeat-containing protein [Halohasta salina]|uniref:right-handed parallel beta-helix repeat-containing protein n=1 Tax=Halohasta salina TaxID=2961621 RepID=UPI0020A3793F|nr:right-handed parallel beta-helix repeat-containing protein [Halohasta salina]
MAERHSDGSGRKAQLNRRDYMRLGGSAVAAAAIGGVGATTSVAAQTETVVDLGAEGLSEGDEIDPYLEEFVDDGVEVRVPEGEYDWDGDGFTGASRDAAIVGQGEVILNNTAGDWYQTIKASGGTVEIRNFTVRGEATGENTRFRLDAESDGRIVVDNLNFPDGSESGGEAKAFYVPRDHAGVIEIRNCYYSGFDDNGIYASSPGYSDGNDGQVIVENCTSHNNNIAGIRIGSSESVVRNCLIINDDDAPRSPSGSRNQRGIRVRAPGDDIVIEDCEIIHSYDGAGAPIQLHRTAEGGSGTINNVRILNNTSNDAISDQDGNTAEGWTGTNISITGDGDLDYPSEFDATTGSDAESPTGEDPQGETVPDRSSSDSGSASADEPAEGTDRLLVSTEPSDGASYEFTATDEITPRYDLDQFNANDDSVGESASENDDGTWTATGQLSGASSSGDSFDVAGELTSVSIDGDSDAVSLFLNGEELPADDLVDAAGDDRSDEDDQSADDSEDVPAESPDEVDEDDLANVLLLDGTVSDDLAQYKIVVSGRIERSDSLSSVADGGSPWDDIEDRVDESTATGVVAKGLDGYRFSGDLVSFQVKGHVDLTVEQAEQ